MLVKDNFDQFYQLTVKSVDNDEIKPKRRNIKSKQKMHYDQPTKEQKTLHTGKTVGMFRDGKCKTANGC